MLNTLDLFSGIGGFALGLHRTGGFRTVAFCEIEEYPRRVLANHWPEVPCYDDVRTLSAERLSADGIRVDVVCGGFPCQGVSAAGRGEGLSDARSGLWSEYARLVGEIGPDWVIVENSPMLRTRGADRVLGDLEAHGYACWPFVVGAAHAGAPHRRQRVFVLAHRHGSRELQPRRSIAEQRRWPGDGAKEILADVDGVGRERRSWADAQTHRRHEPANVSANCDGAGLEVLFNRHAGQRAPVVGAHPWSSEPDVARMVYGVSDRVDRIKALGNSVVPQIVEALGNAILTVNAQLRVAA